METRGYGVIRVPGIPAYLLRRDPSFGHMDCGGVLEDMRGDIFFEPEAAAHRGGKPLLMDPTGPPSRSISWSDSAARVGEGDSDALVQRRHGAALAQSTIGAKVDGAMIHRDPYVFRSSSTAT